MRVSGTIEALGDLLLESSNCAVLRMTAAIICSLARYQIVRDYLIGEKNAVLLQKFLEIVTGQCDRVRLSLYVFNLLLIENLIFIA